MNPHPRRVNHAAFSAARKILDAMQPVLLNVEVPAVFEFLLVTLKEEFAAYEERRAREFRRLLRPESNQ